MKNHVEGWKGIVRICISAAVALLLFIGITVFAPKTLYAAPTNVALNKAAVSLPSKSVLPYSASRAVDGIHNTNYSRWYSSEGSGDRGIQVDLDGVYTINHWNVYHLSSSEGWDDGCITKAFKLQGSTDGTNWSDIDSVDTNTDDLTSRDFAPCSVSYVRLVITQGNQSNNNWASVEEFEVMGSLGSNNADLSNFALSSGILNPAFTAGTTSYSADVSNNISSITVTPTLSDSNATVTVNGVSVTSGQASGPINLNVGGNPISVAVTASDGTTTKTYTATVTRAEAVYTVTFDKNGGDTEANPGTKTATYGGNIGSLPGAPTKTGCTFNGWNTASGGTGTAFDETTAVTGDLTVYAQWNANIYTVTYDAESGTVSPASQSKLFGSTYGKGSDGTTAEALPTPSRTGYTFGGWYDGDNGTGNQVTDATTISTAGDQTLHAKWTANTYTVTFNQNGGDTGANPGTKTATYGGNVGSRPGAPTKTGCTFSGWNTASGGTGTAFDETTAVTGDLTVYAMWTANRYSVTYDGNGNDTGSTPLDSNSYTYQSSVTILDNTGSLVKTGYTFTGWNTTTTGSGLSYAPGDTFAMGTSDVTLYAQWTGNNYTVTFQDWDANVLKTQTVKGGEGATAPPDPSRTGYTFTGWDISFGNVTSDLTVKARYSQNPLSLTMDPNNGATGDTIEFSGKTLASTAVTVQVVKADETEVFSQSLTSDPSGNFSGNFKVPDDMASGLLYGSAQAAGRKVTANVLVHEAAAPYVPPVVINTTTVTVSNDGANKNLELPSTASATSAPITVAIPAAVTDATISVSQTLNSPVGGVVTTQPLPALNIEAVTAVSSSPVKIEMPAEVTISAPASGNWDGTINVPTVKANNTASVSADAGKTATVNTVIEVGYGDIPLTFSKAVRLLIPGMAGKDAGYTRNGSFTKITRILSEDSQSAADTEIPAGGDARIDVGSDLVIWTKHFTSFVAYTQISSSQNGTTSSGGGGSSSPQPSTQVVADSNGDVSVTVSPTLNKETGAASVQVDTATLTGAFAKAKAAADGVKTVIITIPKAEGAKAYETTLPAGFLTAGDVTDKVEIKNGIASITVSSNMLASAGTAGAQNVSLTIASADKSTLDTALQAQIGDRPMIELHLKVDGQQTAWNNAEAPVTVAISYAPTAAELQNPENIVIWYIDGSGEVVTIPNSHYDPATGTVIFCTTHFSYYAVGYGPVRRLAGTDRINTALEIARATYPGKITNAILATANNYPDALAGSVLAQKLNAPILLVGSTDEDQAKVLNYLKNNMDTAGRLYILGGTGAVSAALEEKLQAGGYQNIQRIGGYDAYETAAKITDTLQAETGTPVVLVSGRSFADALSISSMAAIKQYPILLVNQDGIPETVQKELQKIKPEKVYIMGLQGALSPEIEKQVSSLTSLEQTAIIRIGGLDRYATSREAGKYFNLKGGITCIATGNNFPDALTGSIYAATHHAPIMLVDKTLSTEEMQYLQDTGTEELTIFGGAAVVSEDLEKQLSQLFGQ